MLSDHSVNSIVAITVGFDLIPTPTIVFDHERRVQVWNAAAERLFGWTADEVIGGPAPFVPPSRLDEYFTVSSRVRAGETIRDHDTVRLRRDGTTVIVSLTLRPVVDLHGRKFVFMTAIDVTERRRLQAALAASLRRYKEIASTLDKARREQEQLARLLVHDLKSPLAVVLASLEFLRGLSALDTEGQQAIGDALQCARRVNEMALGLLELGTGGGRLSTRRKQVDLRELLLEEIDAGKRLSSVATGFFYSGPSTATLDPDLVRRIVQNLLDNARKYAGGAIRVSCRNDQGHVRILVEDEGPGIASELRERIFEKGFRIESGTCGAAESHGLGLAFCKLAAKALGGEIWVEPNVPTGSRFMLELPAR